MPVARFQPSFAGGVIAPSLYGRIDTAKYDVGLKTGKNVFVHVHGGVSNRAGTRFVMEVPDSAVRHKLLPFIRDNADSHVLVMGENVMKVITNGQVAQDGGSDYQVATPYTAEQARTLDYAQSIDVVFTAQKSRLPGKILRFAETDWQFQDMVFEPSIAAPTGLTLTASHGGGETYEYLVTPVVNGVEGLSGVQASVLSRALNVEGTKITLNWTGSADEYNVYRRRNNVWGYIGYTDGATSFVDDNISPDLTYNPVQTSGYFDQVTEYPIAVATYQQRICYGGSIGFPETLWFSRIGEFENFSKRRSLFADDAFSIDLTGGQTNSVRHFVPLRELLVLTSGGEFSVRGPDNVLSATNPAQTQHGYSGSISVKPIVVDDTALFVDRTGRQVRDMRYTFETDGYTGSNLTVYAPHFFERRQIEGWAYAKNPYSIFPVYLDDGSCLCLTYNREHRVVAWTEFDLSGAIIEDVCFVPEGTFDTIYFLTKRTINGQTKRYVERMDHRDFISVEDAFFVDCGITYDGSPTTTISGLDHLEGETVVALADGDVVENLIVAGGSVTLQRAASKVHVGLPYQAEIETLPPSIELPDVGSARGRPQVIGKMRIQVEKTRGMKVSQATDGRENEVILTKFDLAQQIGMETGMTEIVVPAKWSRDGTIKIRQTYPLPMTILGVAPEYVVGR